MNNQACVSEVRRTKPITLQPARLHMLPEPLRLPTLRGNTLPFPCQALLLTLSPVLRVRLLPHRLEDTDRGQGMI